MKSVAEEYKQSIASTGIYDDEAAFFLSQEKRGRDEKRTEEEREEKRRKGTCLIFLSRKNESCFWKENKRLMI